MKTTITDRVVVGLKGVLGSRLLSATWDRTSLVLTAEGWGFRATCAWRLVHEGVMLVGSDDAQANEWVQKLVGTILSDVQTMAIRTDPILVFGNGWALEVFSSSVVEPWVVHIGGGTVFVASPSDPHAEGGRS